MSNIFQSNVLINRFTICWVFTASDFSTIVVLDKIIYPDTTGHVQEWHRKMFERAPRYHFSATALENYFVDINSTYEQSNIR
jgi:hypothetical protein